MIFSGMTSSNTAEYRFYLKSGVIKFQFIIIITGTILSAFTIYCLIKHVKLPKRQVI